MYQNKKKYGLDEECSIKEREKSYVMNIVGIRIHPYKYYKHKFAR